MGSAVMPYQSVAPAGRPMRRPPSQDDIWGDVGTAQDYLREGTSAYAASLQPAILKEIGNTLASQNAIGALRSGGTTVALGDLGQKYADIASQHAALATERGLEYGLEAHKQRFAEAEAKRRRKSALLGSIGKILGAGIGFAVGGPLGAGIGGKLGEGVTSPGEQEDIYQNFAATNPWFHGQ